MNDEEPQPSTAVAHSFRSPSRRSRSPLTLPVPGSASSSIAVYKARLRNAFAGANPRVCAAFWIFGVLNNLMYVIILSAALDLVGPTLPKAIVLLADVMPSFGAKLFAPYFIHLLPYRVRIPILVALSFCGMQLVAWADLLPARLFGVILASLSAGLGELSFLGMTHFYGSFGIPFWGSGTGAAGLLGAALYVFATSWVGWSVRGSLMVFGFLPILMLFSFFVLLPLGPLKGKSKGYQPIVEEDDNSDETHSHAFTAQNAPDKPFDGFKARMNRVQKLFFPYMLPLMIVYIAEYTVNQGVAPTLLFPIDSMPFAHYREVYPTYNTIYQAGVFISRSSTPFFRVHALYPPSLLQCVNLAILIIHAMTNFIPNIYIIFIIIFWEGLLGGLVYVNTFAEITDELEGEEREFSLGATTVSDSAGICIAGFISMSLELFLCRYQVERGRDYCRLE